MEILDRFGLRSHLNFRRRQLTVDSLIILWTKYVASSQPRNNVEASNGWYKNCPSPIEHLFLSGLTTRLTYPLPHGSLPHHCAHRGVGSLYFLRHFSWGPKEIHIMLSVLVLLSFFFAIGSLARKQSSIRRYPGYSLSQHLCSTHSILLTSLDQTLTNWLMWINPTTPEGRSNWTSCTEVKTSSGETLFPKFCLIIYLLAQPMGFFHWAWSDSWTCSLSEPEWCAIQSTSLSGWRHRSSRSWQYHDAPSRAESWLVSLWSVRQRMSSTQCSDFLEFG